MRVTVEIEVKDNGCVRGHKNACKMRSNYNGTVSFEIDSPDEDAPYTFILSKRELLDALKVLGD